MPDGYEHHLPYVHAILFTLCKKLPESAVMMIAAILVQYFIHFFFFLSLSLL